MMLSLLQFFARLGYYSDILLYDLDLILLQNIVLTPLV